MLELLKYFHYRNAQIIRKMSGDKGDPEFSAMLGVSIFVMMNIGSLLMIVQFAFNVKIFYSDAPKWIIIIVILLIGLSCYFLLFHNEKYLQAAMKFDDEPKRKRILNGYLCLLYVVGSFLLPVLISVVFLSLRNISQ